MFVWITEQAKSTNKKKIKWRHVIRVISFTEMKMLYIVQYFDILICIEMQWYYAALLLNKRLEEHTRSSLKLPVQL